MSVEILQRRERTEPYLSWCLIARNCAADLERCLRSVRERTPDAEIVVVDTMSGDDTVEVAKRYADVVARYRGPAGNWTVEMPWFSDAAAARQQSFDLATGRWTAWIDADDVLPPPDEVLRLLRINNRLDPVPPRAWEHRAEAEPIGLEDALRDLERERPEADCVWAPYLYQRDDHDMAITWQERERIVRDKAKWGWREAAHELLVPVAGHVSPRVTFTRLLYLHERKFTPESMFYSIRRHWDVLLRQYDAGDRTNRRSLYLAEYAKTLAPTRELEFLVDAHRQSTIPLDRYRALLALGGYYGARGLAQDALEAYGAAVMVRPDLPDAWVSGAEMWTGFGDHIRAADWMERGLKIPLSGVESLVNPRHLAVRYPAELAESYRQFARLQVEAGSYDGAQRSLARAVECARAVVQFDGLGDDRREATNFACALENEATAEVMAEYLDRVAGFLFANDESDKVDHLLRAVPHLVEDHPRLVDIEMRMREVDRHKSDAGAYEEFYRNPGKTGYVRTEPSWLTAENALERVKWAADRIRERWPEGEGCEVLEGGCGDGTTGIPLLQMLPRLRYRGIDINPQAVADFRENAARYGVADRCEVSVSSLADFFSAGKFAVILLHEVIEHLPDPVRSIEDLLDGLRADGFVIFSTPWGAYDVGHPPEKTDHGTPRGILGHLRAYTPRSLLADVEDAGGKIDRLERVGGGNALQGPGVISAVVRSDRFLVAPEVHFGVMSALWDWNASTVIRDGIGASEETIVYLARQLARDGHPTHVYGPVPDQEVHEGVGYWPHRQMRHILDGKLVISRAPTWIRKVREWVPDLPAILWLQDASYPDLDDDVAALYERIVVVSQWHGQQMALAHGIKPERMTPIPNFVLPEHFRYDGWAEDFAKRKRDHFLYASSPDRGLIRLLELWPKIRERLLTATLDVCYGWRGCQKLGYGAMFVPPSGWLPRYEKARARFEDLRHQPGISVHGMVNHARLARMYQHAGTWLYPTDFHETCLHPDSHIAVPGDHRGGPPTVRIADLVGKRDFPVYGFDVDAGRFRLGRVLWVAQTKIADELVEIELDDGQTLRCTPDHLLLNFDREWVAAGDVIRGTRLTALHHRYDVRIKDGDGRWTSESRLVGEWTVGRPLRSDEHVDHLDPLRLDNRPDRLRVLTASEHHRRTHAGTRRRKDQVAASTRNLIAWQKENPDAVRAHARQISTEFWRRAREEWTDDERAQFFSRRGDANRAMWSALRRDPEKLARVLSTSRENLGKAQRTTRARLLAMSPEERAEHGRIRLQKAWATRRDRYGETGRAMAQNHTVTAVRRIPGGPVYDMEVEGLHSFVADGVVVHNCCAAAIKARAAGCSLVCPPLAALAETAAGDSTFFVPSADEDDVIIEAVMQSVEVPDDVRRRVSEEALAKDSLTARMPLWRAVLEA